MMSTVVSSRSFLSLVLDVFCWHLQSTTCVTVANYEGGTVKPPY